MTITDIGTVKMCQIKSTEIADEFINNSLTLISKKLVQLKQDPNFIYKELCCLKFFVFSKINNDEIRQEITNLSNAKAGDVDKLKRAKLIVK